jgi:hypothetical protein
MKLIDLFFLVILISCCTIKTVAILGPSVIDPAFTSYYKSFKENTGVNPYRISARFAKIKPDGGRTIIGYCYADGRIEIDPQQWKLLGPYGKEEVVYHELGHCAGGLDHDNRMDDNTRCPYSIMYHAAFGDWYCYERYKDYYIKELKSKMSR